uniref:Uncharacterized protein n=1 Tax=Chelonoidis abingdonii TaxID=106734 RepID=A0A8C0FZW1_CHEAB
VFSPKGNFWEGRKMPVYIRKRPLEIPPPSEKDWIKKDEEENFFLQDPDQIFDSLPQPFRMINKLVTLVFEQAWEIIEKREAPREAQIRKVKPTLYLPTAEFQVMGRANCLAASGQHVFVGLSTGLAVFNTPSCKRICAWESTKLEICAIRASNLGNETHLLVTVDDMGRYPMSFLKSHVGGILRTNLCAMMEWKWWKPFLLLSNCSMQFPNAGSTEAWLEIYRLPKESWLKETDHSQAAAAVSSFRERRFSQASMVQNVFLSYRDTFCLVLSPPSLSIALVLTAPLAALTRLGGFVSTLMGKEVGTLSPNPHFTSPLYCWATIVTHKTSFPRWFL